MRGRLPSSRWPHEFWSCSPPARGRRRLRPVRGRRLSGSGTGSGGSGSGLSASDLGSQSSDKDVTAAVAAYKTLVLGAGDHALRRRPSSSPTRSGPATSPRRRSSSRRAGTSWERIEPIAGLVEEIDGAVDARVDDFASENDPEVDRLAQAGVPALGEEHRGRRRALADQLDKDLGTLKTELKTVEITPQAVAARRR